MQHEPLPERRSALPIEPAVQRLMQLYEQLSPAHLVRLGEYYASGAHFKDPFNDVHGMAAIAQIFEHMFATLDAPRFVVTRQLVQGDQAFLAWTFHFHLRGGRRQAAHRIEGGTLLRFDAQGRVAEHRDHWDAAELYETLPLLGAPMRWLRRRASATAPTTFTIDPNHAHRSPP